MNIQSVPRNPGRRKAAKVRPDAPAATTEAALAAAPPRGRLRGRLFIEPPQLRDKADQLGAQLLEMVGTTVAMGGDPSRSSADEAVVLQVDPMASQIGAYVASEVLRYEEVVTASGVDPATHQERCAQVDAATTAYVNGKQRAQDIEDSLRVMGQSNRQLRIEIKAGVEVALEILPEPEGVALWSAFARIQAEEERLAKLAADQRAGTATENQRGAEVLGQAARQERLLQTMVDLRQGTPVSPARAAEAAATFAAQDAEAPVAAVPAGRRGERRGRGSRRA